MPSQFELIREANEKILNSGISWDNWRYESLKNISEYTGRNVIAYYSSFSDNINSQIIEDDINALMTNIKGMDCKLGLDLILHTPGGSVAATETIIYYLRSKFQENIRAIIPQRAMSCGTIIALSCKEIIMGEHSCIGPVDPFLGEFSVHYVIKEFEDAYAAILENENSANYWIPLLNKYQPTAYDNCINNRDWAYEIVAESLRNNMFKSDKPEEDINIEEKIFKVMDQLGNPKNTKSHNRHIHKNKAIEIGLNIKSLEDIQDFQDMVLTYHHKTMITFSSIKTVNKIVENQNNIRFVGH